MEPRTHQRGLNPHPSTIHRKERAGTRARVRVREFYLFLLLSLLAPFFLIHYEIPGNLPFSVWFRPSVLSPRRRSRRIAPNHPW